MLEEFVGTNKHGLASGVMGPVSWNCSPGCRSQSVVFLSFESGGTCRPMLRRFQQYLLLNVKLSHAATWDTLLLLGHLQESPYLSAGITVYRSATESRYLQHVPETPSGAPTCFGVYAGPSLWLCACTCARASWFEKDVCEATKPRPKLLATGDIFISCAILRQVHGDNRHGRKLGR